MNNKGVESNPGYSCDLLHANARHRAKSEGADQRVGVVTVTDEGVHGQDDQLRLGSGVVDQIPTDEGRSEGQQVDELLQLQRFVVNATNHVGEQHGHVGSDGHGGDHALHGVRDFRHVQTVELLLPLAHLSLLGGIEEALVIAPNALHDFAHHVLCQVDTLVREVANRTYVGHRSCLFGFKSGRRWSPERGAILVNTVVSWFEDGYSVLL